MIGEKVFEYARATSTAFFIAILAAVLAAAPDTAGAASAPLAWEAPTTDVEGSPLTDLAGFKVYIGQAPGVYYQAVDAGNQESYTVDGLGDGTTYYFAVTAYDTSGAESAFSNEAVRTFSAAPAGAQNAAPTFAIEDALSALRYAVGLAQLTPDQLSRYDIAPIGPDGRVNPDGTVNVADAVTILKNVVGLPNGTVSAGASGF